MGLETGTYVSDLNTSNPTAGDPVSQADDHIRLVKGVLQNQFPDASDGPIYGLRAKTAQASTSGTSIDFTSVPSWAKRITVMFVGVSTNGTDNYMIQVGDSGGVEATGYLGVGGDAITGSVAVTSNTTGFLIPAGSASAVIHGAVVLSLVNSSTNTWVASGTLGRTDSARAIWVAGSKSTSATLDRVRITTVGGTNTFDAGTINVLYE